MKLNNGEVETIERDILEEESFIEPSELESIYQAQNELIADENLGSLEDN